MKPVDVAIIGAGPAGASAAICLARKGYQVALVDKAQFPREKLCGDFINPINWPVFRRLGVAEQILSNRHAKVTAFRLTSCSGEEVEVPLPFANGEAAFGLGLRRFFLDQVLLESAVREGAVALQGCTVMELRSDSAGWSVKLDRAGMNESLYARMLIGADGRHSWVAHRLGMAESKTRRPAVGFQMHLRCLKAPVGRVEIHLFPGGYAGLVGLGDNTLTLGFAVEKERLRRHGSLAGLVHSCLPLNPYLKEVLCRCEVVDEVRSTYPVYFAPRRSYGARVLLAGDAARVNEPVSGEGVYFALKSGELAARTVARAFAKSDFSPDHLSSYERQCRSVFRRRQRVNALVRWLIYRPFPASRFIRFSAKKRRLLDSLVQTICQPEAAQ